MHRHAKIRPLGFRQVDLKMLQNCPECSILLHLDLRGALRSNPMLSTNHSQNAPRIVLPVATLNDYKTFTNLPYCFIRTRSELFASVGIVVQIAAAPAVGEQT